MKQQLKVSTYKINDTESRDHCPQTVGFWHTAPLLLIYTLYLAHTHTHTFTQIYTNTHIFLLSNAELLELGTPIHQKKYGGLFEQELRYFVQTQEKVHSTFDNLCNNIATHSLYRSQITLVTYLALYSVQVKYKHSHIDNITKTVQEPSQKKLFSPLLTFGTEDTLAAWSTENSLVLLLVFLIFFF